MFSDLYGTIPMIRIVIISGVVRRFDNIVVDEHNRL